MYFRCRVYGLHLLINTTIDGADAYDFEGAPDVQVHFYSAQHLPFPDPPSHLGQMLIEGVKSDGAQQHAFRVWRTPDDVRIRYSVRDDHLEFTLSPAGDHVGIRWSADFPVADVPAFLFGPVIGCILRLRGASALHAGVVAVNGGAVAFLGDKGAGKSTLIGALARRGFAVLSDDVAALTDVDGAPQVQPGVPCLRMWPQTLQWLGVFDERLRHVESIFDKRYFELTPSLSAEPGAPWRFYPRSLPLRAIYLLAPRSPHGGCTIDATPHTLALHSLLQNGYCDYVLDGTGRLRQFHAMSRLVRRIPLRIIQRPDDLRAVDAVCDAISNTHAH